MKPLTLEETRLKEEMKNNCLKVGKYKDEKAKDKFEMLCHLEDFEVQYWELQQENKELKEVIDKAINNSQYWIDYYTRLNSDERIALRLQENIDILKEAE